MNYQSMHQFELMPNYHYQSDDQNKQAQNELSFSTLLFLVIVTTIITTPVLFAFWC